MSPGDEPEEQWRRPFRSTPVSLLNIDRPEEIGEALKAPDGPLAAPEGRPEEAVTLQVVFDVWSAERQPPERTRYEWLRTIHTLARHMGHPGGATELPALEVTKQSLVSWKAALLAEGRSGKTVKNRFDVIRALYNYALDDGLLPDSTKNPAMGLKVATKSDPAARRLPYSEDDAKVILRATRPETGPSDGCLGS